MDGRRDARRLGLRPDVGRLQALSELAEARSEAHVLGVELRAGFFDDLLEVGQGLARLVERRLAHGCHLDAKGGNELAHSLLRLDEGAGDRGMRGAQVGSKRQHLAVHGASPCVKGGNQRGLAHVFS